MANSEKLLEYLKQGIDNLLRDGAFDGGQKFRKTQREALKAYQSFLNSNLEPHKKLKGFFEIPTGVGKTAVFIGIISSAHKAALADGIDLKTVITVPTIQLLGQTKSAIEKFSPTQRGKIGLYGGRRKNLSKPITVMTYDGWYDLSQSGEISSENVDILISDEAHRGTSERRIENIRDVFNEQTIQIAFTATAHFDEDKSVKSSHERQIYYKSIRDAVQEGELASYIQSQRAIIRVEPTEYLLSEEFQNIPESERFKYRKGLRQNSWNRFALEVFREGRDERTKDLLSDNQAGFFVDGITQANDLEEILNNDPELQKRAAAQSKAGVSVAIHSGLSPKEQKTRFEAYEAGLYMAVIGDEKFKEGFDYPPMKTIVDYSHSSVVDKLQILGRGARKWWNDAKERWEGLTIIDTTIFIGSPNSKEDEQARNNALRYSVSVKDVLESPCIEGPEVDLWAYPSSLKKVFGSPYKSDYIFMDDPNIEYITDIEHIHEIESKVSELRKEHIIEITDDMRQFLCSEIERTGVGQVRFLKQFYPPEGFPVHVINNWQYGYARRANRDYWNWVLDCYTNLPDIDRKPVVKITDELREHLLSEMKRTGVGPINILKTPDKPDTINSSLINVWMRTAQSADEDIWSWLIDRYASLPTVSARIAYTKDHQVKLNEELDRTLFPYSDLVSSSDAPATLNTNLLLSLRKGVVETVDADVLDWIFKKLQALPDSKKIKITEQDRQKLLAEKERTGMGTRKLLQDAKKPEDLTEAMVNRWYQGAVKTAKREHWQYVMKRYEEAPTCNLETVLITDAMRKNLNDEMQRTGTKAMALLTLNGNNVPEGLNLGQIVIWARDGKTAEKSKWDWVIQAYSKLPTSSARIEITDEMKSLLSSEFERTKAKGKAVVKSVPELAESVNFQIIDQIHSERIKSVLESDWEKIIAAYAKLPDAPDHEIIDVTEDMIRTLVEHKDRTGVGAKRLINAFNDAPDDLGHEKLRAWIRQGIKKVRKDHWDWVMSKYEEFPDLG